MAAEPATELREWVAKFGITPDEIVSVGDLPLEFKGTPTVLLVGADSVIRRVWYGVIDSDDESAVMNAL
jgi:hypothetical protein